MSAVVCEIEHRGEYRGAYVATLSTYILLAASFALKLPYTVLALEGAFAIAASAFLLQKDFVSALSLTILVTHIGPILRETLPVVGMVNLGDIYLGLVFLVWAQRHLTRPIYLGPFRALILPMVMLLVISILFLPDFVAALPGYLSLFQLVMFYFVVLNDIRTEEDIDRMLAGIGWAVLVSACLHLIFYSQGVSLGLTETEDDVHSSAILGTRDIAAFIKTSFFYVSFYGSCAAGMVISVCRLVLNGRSGWLERGFWSVVFLIALISSVVAGSRTAVLSAVLSVFVFLSFLALRQVRTRNSGLLVRVLAGISGLIALAAVAVVGVLSENQRDALVQMAIGEAETSIGERLVMWNAIPEKTLEFPSAFVFGVGPDVTWRAGQLPVIRELMNVRGLPYQPPSFHNFYVDIVFQLGFPVFVLLAFIGISTLVRLAKVRGGRPDLTHTFFFAIFAWVLLWNTHATGWSKPVLIMSELFALSHLVIAHRTSDTLRGDRT